MRKKTKTTINNLSEVGWKDLPEDILVEIFNKLDHKCLYETAYSVCRCWRSICRLMLFWNGNGKLSLWRLKNVGADDGSQVMKLVKILLDGLQQKLELVTYFHFPDHVYLSDDDLYYVVQRVPKILELFLPNTTNMITAVGFSRAIQNLRELRSLSIGPIKFSDYTYTIQEIGRVCKNLTYLRICGKDMELNMKDGNTFVLDKRTSLVMAQNLGKVKKLLFEGCLIHKMGLKNPFSKCKSLEYMVIRRCKHAIGNPIKWHPTTYLISKRISEDNTVQWYTTGTIDSFYNSIFSLLDDLWRCRKLTIKYAAVYKQSSDWRRLQ